MTVAEKRAAILARIAEIQAAGSQEEMQDMQAALELLGVTDNG